MPPRFIELTYESKPLLIPTKVKVNIESIGSYFAHPTKKDRTVVRYMSGQEINVIETFEEIEKAIKNA